MSVTDKLLEVIASSPESDDPTEEQIDQILDEANEEFGEAIEAVKKIEEPHLLAILTRGGMGAWENCTDDPVNTPDDLAKIAELVVAIAAEHIAFDRGEEAVAAWLAHLVANNL